MTDQLAEPTPESKSAAIDLEALKVLCNAAHKGPWKSRGMGGDSYVLMPAHRWHCKIYQFDAYPLAIPRPYQDMEGNNAVDYMSAGFAHDDAKFVAEARTAVPALIAIVEATAADRDRLAKALELALSVFDNSLRSAGTSTAGFIATRKLMNKAQIVARAALNEARKL